MSVVMQKNKPQDNAEKTTIWKPICTPLCSFSATLKLHPSIHFCC